MRGSPRGGVIICGLQVQTAQVNGKSRKRRALEPTVPADDREARI